MRHRSILSSIGSSTRNCFASTLGMSDRNKANPRLRLSSLCASPSDYSCSALVWSTAKSIPGEIVLTKGKSGSVHPERERVVRSSEDGDGFAKICVAIALVRVEEKARRGDDSGPCRVQSEN